MQRLEALLLSSCATVRVQEAASVVRRPGSNGGRQVLHWRHAIIYLLLRLTSTIDSLSRFQLPLFGPIGGRWRRRLGHIIGPRSAYTLPVLPRQWKQEPHHRRGPRRPRRPLADLALLAMLAM